MTKNAYKEKCLGVLAERVQAFSNDGFKQVFITDIGYLVVVKMCHKNGTRVSLSLNITEGTVKQKRNGRLVKVVSVC